MSPKRQKCLLKYSEKYNIIHINESIYAGKKIKRTGRKNDEETNEEWKKKCGKDWRRYERRGWRKLCMGFRKEMRQGRNQSWALNTFLYLNTKYMLKMYLNTKYMLKMYLNTKYFLQMYLNTKYIDVLKYFLYYFQNIVLIHSIHYKFENERNIRHKISSIIQYVNNITDMHVIYYITCW